MTVATVRTAEQSLDIVAATPIQYDFPLKDENELEVTYGKECHTAVLGADYAVTLAADYSYFIVTPTAALIAKINALIAGDATEINYITVRRTQSPLTEANENDIRRASFLLNEVERLHMHVSEIWETLWRTLMFRKKNVGVPQDAVYADNITTPGATLVVDDEGTGVKEGPTVAQIEDWSDAAVAARDEAVNAKNTAVASAATTVEQAAIAVGAATSAQEDAATAQAERILAQTARAASEAARDISINSKDAAALSAAAAAADRVLAQAARVAADADAVQTAADRVATGNDVVSTNAAKVAAQAAQALAEAAAAMDTGLTDLAVDGNLVANTSYLSTAAGLVTGTLPAAAAKGSKIKLLGYGAGGWKIAQGAGQQIIFGDVSSTAGAGGYLASTNRYDVITLRCVVANTTWLVESSVGLITVA